MCGQPLSELPTHPELATWRRSSPIAIAYYVGRGIKGFVRDPFQVIAVIGPALLLLPGLIAKALALVAVALVFILIGGLRYWFFRFRVDGDRLLVRQGVVRRSALDLPLDRVQTASFESSFWDRRLGLETIRLDSSGSGGAEALIPSVPETTSRALQDCLRRANEATEQVPTEANDCGDGSEAIADAEAADVLGREAGGTKHVQASVGKSQSRIKDEQTILRLGARDIVRVGIADRSWVIPAFAISFLANRGTESLVGRAIQGALSGLAGLGLVVGGLLVLGFLATVGIALVIAALLRFHGYTLSHGGDSYRSRTGLLTRREVAVSASRVQSVSVSQNSAMRWMKRYRIHALSASASSGSESGRQGISASSDTLNVPIATADVAERIANRMLHGEAGVIPMLPGGPGLARVSQYYIWTIFLRLVLSVPLLAVVAIRYVPMPDMWREATVSHAGTVAFIGLVTWVPLALFFAWLTWRHRGFAFSHHSLVSHRGLLGRRTMGFLFRKAQSVSVRQSPLQRRRGLATLQVSLASGSVSVPYISYALACRLRDRIIFTVESSPLRWY